MAKIKIYKIKKSLSILVLSFTILNSYSQSKNDQQFQKFMFIKCISGDCQNGKGVAQFTASSEQPIFNQQTFVTYDGSFTGGKMAGDGIIYNDKQYYKGSFFNNYFIGNGVAYYSKKEGDSLKPDSSRYVSFYMWDEDGCYQSHGLQRDDFNFDGSSSGHPNKRHKNFGADFAVFNNEWIQQHVKELKATSTKVYTTEVVASDIITNAVKDVYLSLGQYSVVFNSDMIGKLVLGYKKYSVSVDFYKYGKQYHLPSGSSFFYQLINDKNQVVNQQVIQSGITSNSCDFDTVADGKYTIQIAYDYHNCADCEKLNALKLQAKLYSFDFTYRKYLK